MKNYNIIFVIKDEDAILESNNFIKTTSIIKLNCYDRPLLQIQHIFKLYNDWMVLQKLYSSKEINFEFFLCCQLFKITLDNCDNKIKQSLNQIKRINDQLLAKDIKISEKITFA